MSLPYLGMGEPVPDSPFADDEPRLSQPAEPPPLSEIELMRLMTAALESHGVPMTDHVTVLGVDFEVLSLDHGETTAVNHGCRGLDLYTRELEMQRRMLAKAIIKVNGRPIDDIRVLDRFLRKMPPAVVNAIFDRFHALRLMQENVIGGLTDRIKKGLPSTLKESDGASPSTSEPSHGTQGLPC